MNASGTTERAVATIGGAQGGRCAVDGRDVVMLGSNNYLGLAGHENVRQAAMQAIAQFGIGTCINPFFARTPVHEALERLVALHVGTEDAVLFASCSAANAGVLAALAGAGDAIFSDRMNHASIIDGCRLSRAQSSVYEYRDVSGLREALGRCPAGHRLVITDGVFSMEGDVAPIPELLACATTHDATLVIDESHATGVIGPQGAGTLGHFRLEPAANVVLTGTFSKALSGAPGGFAAGSRATIAQLRTSARSFIFTTGMSVPDAAAALAALTQLRTEPAHFARLWEVTRRFRDGLRAAGFQVEDAPSPITPLKVGDVQRAKEIQRRLLACGVYIPAMTHPIVAHGDARLRAQPTAALTREDADRAVHDIARVFAEVRA